MINLELIALFKNLIADCTDEEHLIRRLKFIAEMCNLAILDVRGAETVKDIYMEVVE